MIPPRAAGASGIFPFRFTPELQITLDGFMVHWSLHHNGRKLFCSQSSFAFSISFASHNKCEVEGLALSSPLHG